MADLDRIKRNVEKMSRMGAPIEDIDGYIASEGSTVDQIRAHKPTGGGFLKQFVGNIPAGVLGTVDAAESMLPPQMITGAARKLIGGQTPLEQYKSSGLAPDKPVTSDEKLGATLGDFVGGSVIPGAGWIGGAKSLAAAGMQPATSKVGQLFQAAVEDTAKRPFKSAGFDLVSALTGGTAKHAAEESGAGPVGQTVAALAGGMVPAAPSLLSASPVGSAYRYMTGRGEAARNAVENQRTAWQDAGVREFGPAMTNNPVFRATGEGGAGSLIGGPLRAGAQDSIDDTLGQARRLINRGTNGEPINDVAEAIQSDMRRALTERTRQVKGLPNEELEKLTGPVADTGFMPHRPVIDPVQPREAPPVRPRPVDPESIQIEPIQPREVTPPVRNDRFTQMNDLDLTPEAQLQIREAKANLDGTERYFAQVKNEFNAAAERAGMTPEQMFNQIQENIRARSRPGMLEAYNRYKSPTPAHPEIENYNRVTATYEALEKQRQAYRDAIDNAHMERDARLTEINAREAYVSKRSYDAEVAKYQDDLQKAQREAYEETQRLRSEAIQKAKLAADEEAASRQAELTKQLQKEADDANNAARVAADKEWEAQIANQPGFRTGRSRESYPTEFDAAYERVTRETPSIQRNILGGGGMSGSPYKTSTEQLMDKFGIEGRRQGLVPGYKEGQPFGEAGGWAYNVGPYIDELVGPDVGRRLDAYAKLRAEKKVAPGIGGLRDFRTATREAAQGAERPPFPDTPRTREAAALRQVEGAVTEDMYRFMSEGGEKGQRAAQMWQSIDRSYAEYVKELRKPLSKIFGDNVKPVEAMDRITKAAVDGDLKTLRAFMRVMEEKSDPLRASTAILANLTNNAPSLKEFLAGMAKLHPDARSVIFRGPEGRAVLGQLKALENIAGRLAPYEKAISGGVKINGRGPDITNPANIALGVAAVSNLYLTMFAVGGSAAVARFMASPKYMTWMTRTAQLQNKPQVASNVARLMRFLHDDERSNKIDPRFADTVRKALSMRAEAMTTGNQNNHPYQGVFDAAKSKGVDYKNADPKDVMDAAWEANPTDSMGEMLDAMSKSLGIPPPWERKK